MQNQLSNIIFLFFFFFIGKIGLCQNNDSLNQILNPRAIDFDTINFQPILTGKIDAPAKSTDSIFGCNKSNYTEIMYLGDFNVSNGARFKLLWYLRFESADVHWENNLLHDLILVFDNSNELIGYYNFELNLNFSVRSLTERKLTDGVISLTSYRENYDCRILEPALTDLTNQFPTNLNTKYCNYQIEGDERTEAPIPIYFIPLN